MKSLLESLFDDDILDRDDIMSLKELLYFKKMSDFYKKFKKFKKFGVVSETKMYISPSTGITKLDDGELYILLGEKYGIPILYIGIYGYKYRCIQIYDHIQHSIWNVCRSIKSSNNIDANSKAGLIAYKLNKAYIDQYKELDFVKRHDLA